MIDSEFEAAADRDNRKVLRTSTGDYSLRDLEDAGLDFYHEDQIPRYRHSNSADYWGSKEHQVLTAGELISRLSKVPPGTVVLRQDSSGLYTPLMKEYPTPVRIAPDGTIAVEL